MSRYFPVIGLEVHAQLTTRTKLFCGCELDFGGQPNSRVCPVCLGMPGTLPVPNQEAVDLAIRLGLALNCEIDPAPLWTRKNYFYPDLPKGYQITQTGGIPVYDHPVCKNGWLEITLSDGSTKKIRINRIHMEEDAGKLVHDFSPKSSHFDANRCGTPLCEIVSEPDLRSPEEAVLYLEKLKQILEYTGVCDANMERGNLRADANVSLRPSEDAPFGTRCEIKNLNSFSNLQKAVEAEMALQAITYDSGGTIDQCTKRYDVNNNKTIVIRSKEDAHDYRYFPEPDMVRMTITPAMIEAQQALLPELPDARRTRFVEQYGITAYDAQVLCLDKAVADWFDLAAQNAKNAKLVSNWMTSELLREVKELEGGLAAIKIQPQQLAELVNLIEDGTISGKIAKTVFAEMWESGQDPKAIVEAKGLVQVSDTGAIEAIVESVLDENPAQVAEVLAGKEKTKGFLVGMIMRKSQGKANPGLVNQVLAACLAKRA
jgi:aspartyl-tRNA(Asn)/glutamyl-tRNA(Gln) amidotransferase subunit B